MNKKIAQGAVMKHNNFSMAQNIAAGLLVLALIGCISLLFENMRLFVISMVEKIVLNRRLNNPLLAQQRLKICSFFGMASCLVLGLVVLFPSKTAKIEGVLNRLADKKCLGTSMKDIITEHPFVLISFVFVLYLVKNIFLVTGVTGFNVMVLLAAILIHIGVSFMIYRKRNINPLPHLAVCYGILILSLLISAAVFDYSW
ncbi:MAG: hypothetical protein LBU25_00095, partial [Treponema sp.]|nr:hypothetical protein [Treponema sp.]